MAYRYEDDPELGPIREGRYGEIVTKREDDTRMTIGLIVLGFRLLRVMVPVLLVVAACAAIAGFGLASGK